MHIIQPNYGLTKSKEEALDTSEIVNRLPKAVIRSNTYLLLNGNGGFPLIRLMLACRKAGTCATIIRILHHCRALLKNTFQKLKAVLHHGVIK